MNSTGSHIAVGKSFGGAVAARRVDAFVPLLACQIESMSGENAHLLVSGRSPAVPAVSIPRVEVCGVVVYKRFKFTRGDVPYSKYGIDDGTGISSVQLGVRRQLTDKFLFLGQTATFRGTLKLSDFHRER